MKVRTSRYARTDPPEIFVRVILMFLRAKDTRFLSSDAGEIPAGRGTEWVVRVVEFLGRPGLGVSGETGLRSSLQRLVKKKQEADGHWRNPSLLVGWRARERSGAGRERARERRRKRSLYLLVREDRAKKEAAVTARPLSGVERKGRRSACVPRGACDRRGRKEVVLTSGARSLLREVRRHGAVRRRLRLAAVPAVSLRSRSGKPLLDSGEPPPLCFSLLLWAWFGLPLPRRSVNSSLFFFFASAAVVSHTYLSLTPRLALSQSFLCSA